MDIIFRLLTDTILLSMPDAQHYSRTKLVYDFLSAYKSDPIVKQFVRYFVTAQQRGAKMNVTLGPGGYFTFTGDNHEDLNQHLLHICDVLRSTFINDIIK